MSAIAQHEGTLVVDSRLIADELGIQHKNVLATIKKYVDEIQDFGHLQFKNESVTNSVGARNTTFFYYLNEKQAKFLMGKTRNGLSLESIKKFKLLGFDFSMHTESKKTRKKLKESDYSKALAKSLDGKREVKTLAGNIDVLTQSEIIEIKQVTAWKAALGQVLVYGHYYPSHQKRIHLYGETQESFLKMVKSHCKKFNVIVTWEA